MKPTTLQKALAFTLCLVLLSSVFPGALAAKKPKTAEELGYLPPEELLAEDGKTIRFNDSWVQKALEQQYPHLMEEDGSFLKDSLKGVVSLTIGVDMIDNDRTAYEKVYEAACNEEHFLAEVESVDLSVLQFCTKLYGVTIIAQRVDSLAAFSKSKEWNKWLHLIGIKNLNLDACPSIPKLISLDLAACEVQSYEPLKKCKSLMNLYLSGKAITDISFILQLPKVTCLSLFDASNADLTPLLEKKSLSIVHLDMRGAAENDIRWQVASKCRDLSLRNCLEISPETVEKYLSKCSSIYFFYSEKPAQAVDFSALRGAKDLTDLYFFDANIGDLSFLAELPKLIWFGTEDSLVKNASGLFSAPKLQNIWLENSTIENWGTFEEPAKAKKLSGVIFDSCGLTDLSFVNGLSLKYLWLNGNEITDISLLARAKKIEKLSLSDNPITDFSPLAEIKGLKMVQHNSSETLPEIKKVKIVEGDFGHWAY